VDGGAEGDMHSDDERDGASAERLVEHKLKEERAMVQPGAG